MRSGLAQGRTSQRGDRYTLRRVASLGDSAWQAPRCPATLPSFLATIPQQVSKAKIRGRDCHVVQCPAHLGQPFFVDLVDLCQAVIVTIEPFRVRRDRHTARFLPHDLTKPLQDVGLVGPVGDGAASPPEPKTMTRAK
jgi:hypothetical protein